MESSGQDSHKYLVPAIPNNTLTSAIVVELGEDGEELGNIGMLWKEYFHEECL